MTMMLLMILFVNRESPTGGVSEVQDVDLLDDALVEEGGEEEHEVFGEVCPCVVCKDNENA